MRFLVHQKTMAQYSSIVCGRFTLTSSGEELAAHFEAAGVPDAAPVDEPRYNIAPSQSVAAVRVARAGCPAWAQLRWGLIPAWASDASIGNRLINARSETAADKPAFRDALRRRRCLIAADGFYEWSGTKRVGAGVRTPYWFRVHGGEPFAIAGLWETWRDPARLEVESCTLLTSEANSHVRQFHHRMPVILAPWDYTRWLDPTADLESVLALLVPCPPDWVSSIAVGPTVNDARHEGRECIEPAPAEEP
jgi:putative SOS response-associated peptidase YedK